MKRVKFETVLEIDYINNFKVVQLAFNKVGVTKVSGNSTCTHVENFHLYCCGLLYYHGIFFPVFFFSHIGYVIYSFDQMVIVQQS